MLCVWHLECNAVQEVKCSDIAKVKEAETLAAVNKSKCQDWAKSCPWKCIFFPYFLWIYEKRGTLYGLEGCIHSRLTNGHWAPLQASKVKEGYWVVTLRMSKSNLFRLKMYWKSDPKSTAGFWKMPPSNISTGSRGCNSIWNNIWWLLLQLYTLLHLL